MGEEASCNSSRRVSVRCECFLRIRELRVLLRAVRCTDVDATSRRSARFDLTGMDFGFSIAVRSSLEKREGVIEMWNFGSDLIGTQTDAIMATR